MTSAWFVGATHSVPQSEASVRSTVEPVRTDDSQTVMDHAPGFNELSTDSSGELVGLSPREVVGPTEESEQSAPFWAAPASFNHNRIIDEQVSSSGTAAARELAGRQGHGTMQFTESMEPVIRDGATFGNEYFAPQTTVIQDGAGAYMSPVVTDSWGHAVAQAHAVDKSRQAFNSSLYSTFMNG